MSHHFLIVKGLSYTYSDGSRALNDINIEIHHGESVALLGPNGAGKSTLIKHLNGSMLPQEGTVNIGGIPVSKSTIKSIRESVGIVFQNSDNQLFMPTVFENVGFGLLNKGLRIAEVKDKVTVALEKVKAAHLINKHPFRLSGGEKRKVCLASILTIDPNILVLDEPTTDLDPGSISELSRILNNFSHTKIISTHNLRFACAVCRRGIILYEGRIIADSDIKEIVNDENLLGQAGLLEKY